MRIENRLQLQLCVKNVRKNNRKKTAEILVCAGTGCLAGGSDKIYERFKELTEVMDHLRESDRDCTCRR